MPHPIPRVVALALLSPLLVGLPRVAPERPNVLIFLADDLGWGDLGCYGHPRIETPHLDRFARQGMRLTQCYSASGVCSPSRSAILTGRTPYRNGVYRWIPAGSPVHLRTSEVTSASLLEAAGYQTCHVGKWHLNGLFNQPEQPQPSDHGYDHWFATQNNAAPSHRDPVNFVRNGEAVGALEGYSSLLVVDEAIAWLRRRDPQRPFFLTVWTHEPHLPIETDPAIRERYSDLEDADLRQHHGNVTQLDLAFGNLMGALDELGLREDTLVVFTSDNGPEGNGRDGRTRGSTGGLRGRKRDVLEGGIRVPGIVRWPGRVRPGIEVSEPVIGTDLFPTACAVAGVPVPDDRVIDGASLLPLFAGGRVERPVPLYWRCRIAGSGLQVALRSGDWKILAPADLSRFELYHLGRDWRETTDLAAEEPEVLERLRGQLVALQGEIEAEGPDWWRTLDRPKPIGPGVDETGDFDQVLACKVTEGGLGYELSAGREGLALQRLDPPITERTVYELEYRTLRPSGTRNAALVFGAETGNDETFKCGTGMGMGAHLLFRGGWGAIGAGVQVPTEFDPAKTFRMRVTIDPRAHRVLAEVDGVEMELALPQDLTEVRWVGYYVKETASTFGPLVREGS